MKQLTLDILRYWQQLKPEREAVKDRLAQKFSLEFNYNSNHIEGNTLTYGQTEILLLFGILLFLVKITSIAIRQKIAQIWTAKKTGPY